MSTDNDFVLTADSRAGSILWQVMPLYRDDECKIRAFNNDVVFAAAGVIANNRGRVWLTWDIRQTAADIVQGKVMHTGADIDAAARDWARQVQTIVNQDFSLITLR